MNFQVVNKELCVGSVRVVGVTSSSIFIIGDTETINLSSTFDTPAESFIVGPFMTLPSDETEEEEDYND